MYLEYFLLVVCCTAVRSTPQDNIVSISPRHAMRHVGDDLTVLCKVPYPIDSCRMNVGSTSYSLRPGDHDGDVIYSGQGFNYGECGAHIKNVKKEWNGNIFCFLPSQTGNIEVKGTMRLLVGETSLVIRMNVNGYNVISKGTVNYRAGDRITFFCDTADKADRAVISNQKVVHKRNGSSIVLPNNKTNSFVTYIISADDFDNESEVYCTAEIFDSTVNKYFPIRSEHKKLIRYPGKDMEIADTLFTDSYISFPDRCYGTDAKNPLMLNVRKMVNGTYYTLRLSPKWINLTSADSGITYYCDSIQTKWSNYDEITSLTFIRQISQRVVYYYWPWITRENLMTGLRLLVNINGKDVGVEDGDTVNYNKGDNITFTCHVMYSIYDYRTYNRRFIQKRDGSNPQRPVDYKMYYSPYSIIADDLDHNSEMYCFATVKEELTGKVYTAQSPVKKLISNSGGQPNST